MSESISKKINRFYSLISNYKEGAPNTRYKSWEWCHNIFLKLKDEYWKSTKDKRKNEIIDLLSLHLAFYLASWGMYRGSSYLLQRDYKAHKKAIKEILNKEYRDLWNYDPLKVNKDHTHDLLFKKNKGIYWKIKKSYPGYKKGQYDVPSDTLATKILMGTFGCIPAFDRYLKDGIGNYKKVKKLQKIGNYKLTKSIENKYGATQSFKALSEFAFNNVKELKKGAPNANYPIMKLVDMYFWEIGYELDLLSRLKKDNKRAKAKEQAIQLNLCKRNDSLRIVCEKISNLNS